MTREEAIKWFRENPFYHANHVPFNMAIKALEQEPILDKIREQIKSNIRGVEITLEVLAENDPLIPKMEGAKDTLENCLEIIDKAESEVSDADSN